MTIPSEPRSHSSSHADLDLDRRRLKALKIERLLDMRANESPLRLLEVGTGSGAIAHYFATRGTQFEVSAVDVSDQRVQTGGYEFRLIADTTLPYADSTFDVVISNHVIEHVGTRRDQLDHLKEIRRVMARRGVGYLATPNRWAPIEPHFRLPFLSWLPEGWRSRYLSAMRRGSDYDCSPLGPLELDALLSEADLTYRGIELEAICAWVGGKAPLTVIGQICSRLPRWIGKLLAPISPTLVRRLESPLDD